MASIRRRAGGWEIAWREGGKTRFRQFPGSGDWTKREADAAKRLFEGEHTLTRQLVTTGLKRFGDALDEFLAEKRDRRAPETARTYRKHAANFGRGLPLTIRLRDVTTELLEGYLAARRKATSPTTANKERVTLATFFRWAIRRRLVSPPSPVEPIEPFAAERREPHVATKAELVRHLRELRADLRGCVHSHERHVRRLQAHVCRVLWRMGLRVGEVCRWTLADLNPTRDAVKVRAARNKGGTRWVPIPRALRGIFARWIATATDGTPIFCSSAGGSAYGALQLFRTRWNARARRSGGYAPAPNYHAFRHAFASRTDGAGLDRALVSRGLLGHATIAMTERYTHRELEALRRAQEILERHERASSRRPPE